MKFTTSCLLDPELEGALKDWRWNCVMFNPSVPYYDKLPRILSSFGQRHLYWVYFFYHTPTLSYCIYTNLLRPSICCKFFLTIFSFCKTVGYLLIDCSLSMAPLCTAHFQFSMIMVADLSHKIFSDILNSGCLKSVNFDAWNDNCHIVIP